jgi:hypothetical protein
MCAVFAVVALQPHSYRLALLKNTHVINYYGSILLIRRVNPCLIEGRYKVENDAFLDLAIVWTSSS